MLCSGGLLSLGDPLSAVPISPLPKQIVQIETTPPPRFVPKSASLSGGKADKDAARGPSFPIRHEPLRSVMLSSTHIQGSHARSCTHAQVPRVLGHPSGRTRGEAASATCPAQLRETHAPEQTVPTATTHQVQVPCPCDSAAAAKSSATEATCSAAVCECNRHDQRVPTGAVATADVAEGADKEDEVSEARSRSTDGQALEQGWLALDSKSASGASAPRNRDSGRQAPSRCARGSELGSAMPDTISESKVAAALTAIAPPDVFSQQHIPGNEDLEGGQAPPLKQADDSNQANLLSILLSPFLHSPDVPGAAQDNSVSAPGRARQNHCELQRSATVAAASGRLLAIEVPRKRLGNSSVSAFHQRNKYTASSYTSTVSLLLGCMCFSASALCVLSTTHNGDGQVAAEQKRGRAE